MRLLKYIIKEIKNNRRFTLLFIINLSLGLTGFIALDGFKSSIDKTMKLRSKAVLGADFGISARRPLTEAEHQLVQEVIPDAKESADLVELYSMVSDPNGKSRLVQIQAISEGYPFYGDIELQSSKKGWSEKRKALHSQPQAWVYPELLTQLKLEIGDYVQLGNAKLQVMDSVTYDSTAGLGSQFAPRIFVGIDTLEETGLVQPGSIAWHSKLYFIPGSHSEELEAHKSLVFERLESPEVRVYTHQDASEQMGRLLERLNDYLGLASLVALFLAAVGTGFLFRSYFNRKVKQIATLITLGLSPDKALMLYACQLMVLGFLSAIIAVFLSLGLVPGLGLITKELVPFEIILELNLSTLIIGILLGCFGSVLICLPFLFQLRKLNPSILFSESIASARVWSGSSMAMILPALISFWGLAVWQSHSLKIGSLFVASFLGSSVALGFLAFVVFYLLGRVTIRSRLSLKWALRDISRDRVTSLSCFLTVGLGVVLMNLIPQLQATLSEELQRPESGRLPSLFMVDIQEDQVGLLEQIVQDEGVSLSQLSPTIRARLISVNGERFEKGQGTSSGLSREEEREMRFRNRGFNLSYRDKLTPAETIVEGVAVEGQYDETKDEMPAISVEQRFADRLGFRVGDVLEFEIESVPVKGRIVNLRTVKWTAFQPNFFVQFQPGVLESAPKMYLATVPSLSREKKIGLQDKIVSQLPNVTVIDVSRIVERIGGLIQQMSWALQFMALLCLIAGFVVIYSIANHQARQRRWEIGLLKALGAHFSVIRGYFLWQFGLLAFFAALFGMIISLVVSYVISKIVFKALWIFDWVDPTICLFAVVVLSLFITDWATRQSLKVKTRDLFSS